ncbi:MAG: hypothetical protein ABIP55_16735 [Tepidisphaeraceae bacterium]
MFLAQVWLALDPAARRNEDWSGLSQFMFIFRTGIVLVPMGALLGICSFFTRRREKATSTAATLLNGSVMMISLLRHF